MQPKPRRLKLGRNAQIPHSAKSEHPADLFLKTGIPGQQAELEIIVLAGLFGREHTRKDEALAHFVFFRILEPDCAAKSNANRPVGKLQRSVGGNPEGTEGSLAQTANRVGGKPQDFAIE
jgi:hypothetical protein